MPDKFEDDWEMELPTSFDRYVNDDHIPIHVTVAQPLINKTVILNT